MQNISAQQIASAINGKLIQGNGATEVNSVSTDTRALMDGAVFFALVGESFNANDFLGKAVEQGASVIVSQRVCEEVQRADVTVIHVEDSLVALQKFAAWYRKQLELHVIGITGSNGKTSTKDFTKAVLNAAFKVNATKGNLNNHIGLPLTILNTEEDDKAAVWEMGMNHPGEIAPLCQIALPKIGIITNIGTAHIEYMGSREAIAEEKGELARALPEDGFLIVPASCDYADYFKQRTKAKMVIVGNGRGLVRAENIKMGEVGSSFTLCIEGEEPATVSLPVIGKHMIANAMLAAGAGYVLGMKPDVIAGALSNAELTSGRLKLLDVGGVRVIDDTYNANLESVRAAIDTLAELELPQGGKRFVVLGKLAELGEHAADAYRQLGSHAASIGMKVVSVGDEAKSISEEAEAKGADAKHFSVAEDAADWLRSQCEEGDAVLFKGSRAAAMEKVLEKSFY